MKGVIEMDVKRKLNRLRNKYYKLMIENIEKYNMCHLTCITGFGKSWIFKKYIKNNPDKKICYISKGKDLILNMEAELCKLNSNIITKTYMKLAQKKTFKHVLACILECDIIIFDESHCMGANNCDKIIAACKKKGITIIGGTASPIRGDGINIITKFFHEDCTIHYGFQDAIKDKLLIEPESVSTVCLDYRLEKIKDQLLNHDSGGWALTKLKNRERSLSLRSGMEQTIVDSVNRQGVGIYLIYHPTIDILIKMRKVFDDLFKKHFKDIQTFAVTSRSYNENTCMDGDMFHYNVQEFIEQHNAENSSGFSVVHAVDMMTYGWHFDDIVCLMFNSITCSPIKEIQQLGRGINLGSDKQLLLVDFVGRFLVEKRFKTINTQVQHDDDIRNNRDTKHPLFQYTINTDPEIIEFSKILNEIEKWMLTKPTLTPEKALETIEKYGNSIKNAARACGLNEEIFKQLLEI